MSFPAAKVEGGTLSPSEKFVAYGRMAQDLTGIGPANSFLGGFVAVFGLGVREGMLHCRPSGAALSAQWSFSIRYGFSNIVSSLVWNAQPASLIAETANFKGLYAKDALPTRNALRINRLAALRGALAGSVLLTQLLAAVTVLQTAEQDYSDRIYNGREPPLSSSSLFLNGKQQQQQQQQQIGVVVRLAGKESDVTTLSMKRMGRTRLWPIYEEPVRALVQEHNFGKQIAQIPIYWRVENGRYSYASSYQNLKIPPSWLFSTKTGERMLILEADATPGGGSSLSLTRYASQDELDLDLKEAAQGFSRLRQTLACDDDQVVRTMRVLLVDASTTVTSGGGRSSTARQVVEEYNFADVVIDARELLVRRMVQWLEKSQGAKGTHGGWRRRRVILETPSNKWFASIREELAIQGYAVIDMKDAAKFIDERGRFTVPLMVYEQTAANTMHTIQELVRAEKVWPDKACALLVNHDEGNPGVATGEAVEQISSSDLYDRAFSFVRKQALDGRSAAEIQARLDDGIF